MRRRTTAVIGITATLGGFGGLGVNIAFRESFQRTGTGEPAFAIFVALYALCAVVTWRAYVWSRVSTTAAQPASAPAPEAEPEFAPAPSFAQCPACSHLFFPTPSIPGPCRLAEDPDERGAAATASAIPRVAS